MKVGHNRVGGVAVDQLKSIISRVEKLEEEKSAIAGDIRDVFAEAKGNGFDTKAIKQILKIRRMDAQQAEEQETIFDTYRRALGMLPQLDLFDEEKSVKNTQKKEHDDEEEIEEGDDEISALEKEAADLT